MRWLEHQGVTQGGRCASGRWEGRSGDAGRGERTEQERAIPPGGSPSLLQAKLGASRRPNPPVQWLGAPVQSEKGPEPQTSPPHLISCPFHHLLNSSGLSILALGIKALNLVISKDPGLVLCARTASRSPWVVTETWRHDTQNIFWPQNLLIVW